MVERGVLGAVSLRLGVTLLCDQCGFGYAPGRPVIRGVSAAFSPGRVTGVIGPNAGGKTTLLRLLAGLRTPERGRVTLAGAGIGEMSVSERARRLVFVPQRSEVAFAFAAREIVALGGLGAEGRAAERVERALAAVELGDVGETVFSNLSAGQQQRATLARALVQVDAWNEGGGHRFVLADEPVSAMDPKHAVSALDVLRDVAARGIGVVCVLHDLALVLRFCDDVLLLKQDGTVLALGPTRETLTPERLEELYGVGFETLRGERGDAAGFIPVAGPAMTLR